MCDDDLIANIIGSFGRYQTWILVVVTLAHLPTDYFMNNVLFVLPHVDYVCKDDDAYNLTNYCPCQNPDYDRSAIVESATSEWNLICERTHLASLAQSAMQVGMLTGSLIYGHISDRYGRKAAVLLGLFCQPLFGTITAFVPEYWMFVMMRFLMGTAAGGVMLCVYVLLIEYSGKLFRPYMLGLHEVSYVLGYLLLSVFGYYLRKWRDFQLATAAPWLAVILLYWILPESPRWLITVGRKKEAIELLTYVAKKNNRNTDNIDIIVHEIEQQSMCERTQRRGSYLDLFKTPKLRMYTTINALMWMCCAHAYFGVNQYIGRLQGNIYLNVLLSAVSHVPNLLVMVFFAVFVRRKINVFITFGVAAISLLAFIFIPTSWHITSVAVAISGQLAMYATFALVYLYTTELFPTLIRNSAMGFSSVFARVGAFVAPFVVNIGVEWISITIFSTVAFCGALLCCFLPETKNIVLLNSIQQTEQKAKK
ncbi:organic cation transporter protein-like isoform X2 [Pectinophora gossypiella]|nr:organic cation transporter protein-like isoform X2 [Pectinophora gossypiella]